MSVVRPTVLHFRPSSVKVRTVAIQRHPMEHQRIFTVDEANALIPTLDEVFGELETCREELDHRMDRLKILDVLWGGQLQDPGNPDREEFLRLRSGVRTAIRRIERIVEDRILELGVRFPAGGLEHGLVDFPTTLDGRIVFLCWRRGEGQIQAWHELDGGYAGRQPLTPAEAKRMGRQGDPGEGGFDG